MSVLFEVGRLNPRNKMPANTVSVSISRPLTPEGELAPSVEIIDALMSSMVRAWRPLSAAAYDLEAISAVLGRGRFEPRVGQRAWISSRLGFIADGDPRVSLRTADDGTYLSVDDAVPSSDAGKVLDDLFRNNGIAPTPAS